tara:strand:- start:266 stop:637 length:372 start_codon:yes stop_codon:yes gene_type:complete
MNREFNLYVYSNDANFCSALAIECNSYGFELTFFEMVDVRNDFIGDSKVFSVIIIDLSEKDLDERLKAAEKIRLKTDFPIFGTANKLSKELQNKTKDYGYDLIFTKRMLLKSLKKVVAHVLDQ